MRRSLRLSGYDYSQNGVYFVTICTHRKASLFGSVRGGVMTLNTVGRIVDEEWRKTASLRSNVQLDAFAVMPNHLHGIIVIHGEDELRNQLSASAESGTEQNGKFLQAGSLGAIIGRFKGSVTKRVHGFANCRHQTIWQRNYYDHIVRTEKSLQAIREYVAMNPAYWEQDLYFDYVEFETDIFRD